MAPRVIGPSASVPGAVDVQRDDGVVLAVPAGAAQGLEPMQPVAVPGADALGGAGASAPMAQTGGGVPDFLRGITEQPAPPQQVTALGAPAPAGGIISTPGAEFQQRTNQAVPVTTLPTPSAEQPAPGTEQPAAPPQQPAETRGLGGFLREEAAIREAERFFPQRTVGQGPPRVITEQTTRQRLATPEGEAEAEQARAERREAEVAEQSAISEAALQEARKLQGGALVLERLGADLEVADRETAALADEQRERIGQLLVQREDLVQRAEAEIDPGRFWGDQTTGQKVRIAFGQALSAIGQSLRAAAGQQVQPESVIQRLIDRDIALQERQIDLAQRGIGQVDNALAQVSAQTGDLLQARGAMRDLAINRAQLEIQALAEDVGSQQAFEEANRLIAQLDQQRAERRVAEIAQRVGTTTEQTTMQRREGRRVVGGLSREQRARIRELAGEEREFDRERAESQGVDPADRRQFSTRMAGVESGLATIADIERTSRGLAESTGEGVGPVSGRVASTLLETPASNLVREDVQRLAQQFDDLASQIVKARSGAAATDAEREALKQAFGLTLSATPAQIQEGLRRARRELEIAQQNAELGASPGTLAERRQRQSDRDAAAEAAQQRERQRGLPQVSEGLRVRRQGGGG